MKNPSKLRHTSLKIAAVAAACAAVALGLQGCGVGDATPPPVVLVPPPVVAAQVTTASYSVVIRDAATGALVTDATTLTFSGAGLINATGGALTTATTSTGLLALATGPGTNAAASFTVKTQSRAAGWEDGQATVAVVASTDVQNIEIRVANVNRVAALQASTAPVAAAAASAPATNGQLAAPLAAATAPKTVTSIAGTPVVLPPATVAVPATARLTTAAGVAATGPLTLAVVAPSLSTPQGLAEVPGGVTAPRLSSGPTGAPVTGKVRIAGVASFTLTDGAGNRITNFSEPVIARIPVTRGTRIASGARLLAVGDTFPVYVRNEATNQWDFRRIGNVVASGAGLAVEFPTTTFSEFALLVEEVLVSVGISNGLCQSTISFTGTAGLTGKLGVSVSQFDGAGTDYALVQVGQRAGPFTLLNGALAAAIDVANPPTIILVTNDRGVTLASTSIANPCGDISVALTAPPPPAGSMAVTLREQCPDGSNNRPFQATVTVFTGNNPPQSAKGIGSVNFTGLVPGSYSVTAVPTSGAVIPAQATSIATGPGSTDFLRIMSCATGTGGG